MNFSVENVNEKYHKIGRGNFAIYWESHGKKRINDSSTYSKLIQFDNDVMYAVILSYDDVSFLQHLEKFHCV